MTAADEALAGVIAEVLREVIPPLKTRIAAGDAKIAALEARIKMLEARTKDGDA